jgi:hypothetical protein
MFPALLHCTSTETYLAEYDGVPVYAKTNREAGV